MINSKDLKNYISDYLYAAKEIAEKNIEQPIIVIQFFQKKDFAILSGINECIDLLTSNLNKEQIKIRYLPEGSKIGNREVVLELEGLYQDLCIFEGLIDGILSRWTSISTNSYNCVLAAGNKPIISMSDRSDHYITFGIDGKAMQIGGIKDFSTKIHAPKELNIESYGSIPHGLIQNYRGDLVSCMKKYYELFPHHKIIALVDYHNNIIEDSLKVLKELKDNLYGVRIDTSMNMKDKMFNNCDNEYGVTKNQIFKLKEALINNGGKDVKIFVSSGFTPEKIKDFELHKTPVDGYGVGEYLLKINNLFTGDATLWNNQSEAKEGRKYNNNPKLITYKWKE